MSLYHVAKPDGTRMGPYEISMLNSMLASGVLPPNSLVWTEGWADWRPITTIAATPVPAGGSSSWGPITAFKTVVFSRYASFSGRASRSEYWWYSLMCTLMFILSLAVCIWIAVGLNRDAGTVFAFYVLFWLVMGLILMIPGIAVTVRRLHDAGYSGWLFLLNFIPWVGGLAIFVFMLLPSAPPNQWGIGPDGPAD